MKRGIVVPATIVAGVLLGAAAWLALNSTGPAGGAPAAATVGDIADRSADGRRVIFVGLDGADWTLLDQYIDRGVMPNLGRLVKEGSSGTLATIHPPLSPLVWTSMLTGASPLDHRVLDFLRINPVSHEREPITSDERQVPAVWNMATAGGKRVGAFGFWATYPAEAVNGVIVSDRLFTFLYSESSPPPGIVNPPALENWARETLRQAEQAVGFDQLKELLPWLTEREYAEGAAKQDPYSHPVSALRRILIETRVYDTLSRDWFVREQPDLLLVYIQGTDSIGHVFAPYAPPRQPSISPSDYERYSEVPERFFAALDRQLDEYRQLAESTGAVLMLASDHGFRWGEGRPTTLSSVTNSTAARWHTDDGMYLLWGKDVETSRGHAGRGNVQQVCATLLSLLGLPSGKDLAGPSLPGVRESPGDPVDYRAHYSPGAVVTASSSRAATRADAETVAKLQALGYIGAASGTGRPIGTRTAGSFNNEALLLKAQGRTKEASEAFEQALVVDPDLASALWNLSDLLFAENTSPDKSDALLVRAFAKGLPEGRRYVIGRAIGYQRNGRADRSLKLLTDAVAAKPDDPEVWLFRGRYRMDAGDCAGAANDFLRATQLDPRHAAAFAALGVAHVCTGDLPSARESFTRSLQLDPNQPKVRDYLRASRHNSR